ncbi:MAG: hypothetical protein MZV70_74400 [Desulfobacterales bacterium]|nr:hypothetical protein [Desulfobacterales bacterium]
MWDDRILRSSLRVVDWEWKTMSQYSEKLIGLLPNDHPDLSGWTIICASDRAADPVQHLIHRELGGILPKVEGFHSVCNQERSASSIESVSLVPVDEQLALLYPVHCRKISG